MTKIAKYFGFFILFLGSLEGFARLLPLVTPKTVYEPFLVTARRASWEAYGKASSHTLRHWRTNNRGARGDFYRNQPIRVAFFGTSTTACTLLSQEHSWPEQFRSQFSHVHVDNFARDYAASREATEILKDLHAQGVHYDAVVIMTRPSQRWEIRRNRKPQAFHYWGKVAYSSSPLRAWEILSRRISAHRWNFSLLPQKLHAAPKKPIHPRAFSNRSIRASGEIQYCDYPADFRLGKPETESVKNEAHRVFEAALKVSPHVFFLSEPVAFDELEVPGVERRWYLLDEVPDNEGCYVSNRSQAFIRRIRSQWMQEVAKQYPVHFFDLDGEIRVRLRSREDLYLDHNHFSVQGAALAGKLFADHVKSLPPFKPFPPAKSNLQLTHTSLEPNVTQ